MIDDDFLLLLIILDLSHRDLMFTLHNINKKSNFEALKPFRVQFWRHVFQAVDVVLSETP